MTETIREYLINGTGLATIALAAARIGVGVFFAIAGKQKLLNENGRGDDVRELFRTLHLPWPRLLRWFVPATEAVAGTLLTLGLGAVPAALALLCICAVAMCTDGINRVREAEPYDRADWLDNLLYLPEVHMGLALLLVLCAGPGGLSLDHLLWR